MDSILYSTLEDNDDMMTVMWSECVGWLLLRQHQQHQQHQHQHQQ